MDHWTRIEAAIEGGKVDCVPVALWRHFPGDDQDPEQLAARTLEWQKAWDFDLVKFMPSGTFSVEDWGAKSVYENAANGARAIAAPGIRRIEDWRRLPRLDARQGVLGAQNAALRRAARELGGRVPVLQTVFSPLTTARKLAGEPLLAQLLEDPDAVEAGLRTITETTVDFALAALDAGAHGLFFATQLATTDVLGAAEYRRFGVRFDLEILEAVRSRSRVNMLHLHGRNIMFDLLADYPVQLVNWHDRLTAPSLGNALRKFRGAVTGGVEELGVLVSGSEQDVRAQVRDAIAQTQGRRLVVGPGCVAGIAAPERNIRAVIDETRKAS